MSYQKLRKLYNDTFYPDGVPFEDGCEIQAEYSGFYINEGGSESYGDTEYQLAVVWKGETVSHQYDIVDGITKDNFEEIIKEGLEDGIKYTNLGKPLTLQMIFNLFAEINPFNFPVTMSIHSKAKFAPTNDLLFHLKGAGCELEIDLSIPFQEQPDEVFEKIYQLIKEEDE